MVLVHDDDLAELRGIYDDTVRKNSYFTLIFFFFLLQLIESLQPAAVMLSHL